MNDKLYLDIGSIIVYEPELTKIYQITLLYEVTIHEFWY